MWIASISALSFNLMIVCSVIRKICVSDQWNKKDSVQGKWFFFLVLCSGGKKKSKWLNEALICRVVCQEDEKATICPITPTLALNQTVSGDVGWDERLWEMGMANVAICPAILPPSICLILLHLLFCYHTQTHINTLSLCVSACLSVIFSSNTRPLSPALCYWHSHFRPSGEGSVNRDLLWSLFVLILQNMAQYLSGNSVYLICCCRCAVTRALV